MIPLNPMKKPNKSIQTNENPLSLERADLKSLLLGGAWLRLAKRACEASASMLAALTSALERGQRWREVLEVLESAKGRSLQIDLVS